MKVLKIVPQITRLNSDSFTKYIQEVAKLSRGNSLTAEEEVKLIKRIRNGDEKAEREFIEKNLRFVISVAKQFHGQGCLIEDIISEGNYGLIKAVRKYDASRGFKFITYAVWWIRQSILSYINENGRMIRLPNNKIGQLNKIRRAQEKLEQMYDRKPTSDEVSDFLDLNLDAEEIEGTLALNENPKSLSESVSNKKSDSEEFDIEYYLADTDSKKTDEVLNDEDIKIIIKEVLSGISMMHKKVIELHYGLTGKDPKTFEEISISEGLTPERIRQIKTVAIKKMRSAKNFNLIKPYI